VAVEHQRQLVQASMSQGPFPRAALCSLTPSSGNTAPPPPSRLPATSRGSPLIRRRAPPNRSGRAGEGFSSSCVHLLIVPLPIPREVLGRCNPGSSRRPSAFAVTHAARLLLGPLRAAITRRQDSLEVTDRISCSPQRALDTGLRRRAFPPDAASLLPGVLTLTGTGLTPAGERKLAHRSPHAAITSQA
jgi:hypothetical protein